MKQIEYTISTKSPILMSTEAGDRNLTETLDYFPGRVVLGILAGKFIRDNKLSEAHSNELFRKLFLINQVIYENANIVTTGNTRTEVTPMSVQSLKNDKKTIYDLLNESVNEQTTAVGGYSVFEGSEIDVLTPKKKISFHHATDEDRRVPKEGLIFNYESLESGQTFKGRILFEDDKEVQEFLEALAQFEAYVGRSKTAEYGHVELSFGKNANAVSNDVKLSDGKVSLCLLSDLLLFDDNGYSSADVGFLEKYLQGKINDKVKFEKSFAKTKVLENYVGVWKLKRPSEVCFSAGSCFLISGVTDTEIEKLKGMELCGIGERRNEGLGRLTFNINTEKVLTQKERNKEVVMPNSPIPDIALEVLKSGIRNYLISEVKSKAAKDAESLLNSYPKGISNSLIGRLESFVKSSNTEVDFMGNVEALRKPAKEQLNKGEIRHKDFFEFLKLPISDTFIIPELSIDIEDLKQTYNEVYNSIKPKLFEIYYLTMLPIYKKLQMTRVKKKLRSSENREGGNENG